MKKRIISLMLSLCMLFVFAVPAHAGGAAVSTLSVNALSDSDLDTSDSDLDLSDSDVVIDVEAVYDAHIAVHTALAGSDIDELAAAMEAFMLVVDMLNEMDEDDFAELGALMDCTGEEAFERVFSDHVDANVVLETAALCDTYEADPNTKTAYDLVTQYNYIFNDPDYDGYADVVERFIPDIDDIYNAALTDMPSDEVVELIDNCNAISDAINSSEFTELLAVEPLISEVRDAVDALTGQQLEELGVLLEATPEECVDAIDDLLGTAEIILEAGYIYNAYIEEQSPENAEAFVAMYEKIYIEKAYGEEVQVTLFWFFMDIEEIYLSLTPVTRLAGGSRTETAVVISERTFEWAPDVVLASGDDYADALAGGALASALAAPILLVRGDELDEATINELIRLEAENVHILGGELAVSAEVEDFLEEEGYNVTRYAGDNRFETAVEIAKAVRELWREPTEVYFSYSHGFADALAISSVSATLGCPVLYIDKDGSLDAATREFIESCTEIEKAVILGGELAVSNDAVANINAAGIDTVERIGGSSRFDTCLRINRAYDYLWDGSSVCIATGFAYPDALAGSVFAAFYCAPILLVGDTFGDELIEYMGELNPARSYILGGTMAVSEEIENTLIAGYQGLL